MKKINMRKRRTGIWCSMGGGSYNSPNVKGDAADDASDDSDDDQDDPEPNRVQQLSSEAARYRRRLREKERETEQLKAQLAKDGKEPPAPPPPVGTMVSTVQALIRAGISADAIELIADRIDWSDVASPEDVVDELRERHPSLFGQASDDDAPKKMGRTAPAMNNGRRKPGKETEEQRRIRLSQKYPALQGRWMPR